MCEAISAEGLKVKEIIGRLSSIEVQIQEWLDGHPTIGIYHIEKSVIKDNQNTIIVSFTIFYKL